jgi:hypothetical protein
MNLEINIKVTNKIIRIKKYIYVELINSQTYKGNLQIK